MLFSVIFFMIHLKTGLMWEILILPFQLNSVKDFIYHIKLMRSFKKLKFKHLLSKITLMKNYRGTLYRVSP